MESYRQVWNNFFNYLKEHFGIKNFELIEPYHVIAYMDYKLEYYPSKKYLQKINSALGKLEIALNHFSQEVRDTPNAYDFSIRHAIYKEAGSLKLIASNYHNRAYKNPQNLIQNITEKNHQLAAKIQWQGGARIEGVALIKQEQLLGTKFDPITQAEKGIIFTKEKGGKEGEVLINIGTYQELVTYLSQNKIFNINRQKYYQDIKQAALKTNQTPEASHGLRWNFAKRRMFEYAQAGYSYEECLQQVSYEMKHNRANITTHYLA